VAISSFGLKYWHLSGDHICAGTHGTFVQQFTKQWIYILIRMSYRSQYISSHNLLTCRLVLGSLAIRWPPRSNSLTCLLSWGIATTPLLETANRFTAESDRIVASDDRMFRRSHTLTLRSSEPDTTLSSLVNTAHVTVLRSAHFTNWRPSQVPHS
jgi:hypothetical protein